MGKTLWIIIVVLFIIAFILNVLLGFSSSPAGPELPSYIPPETMPADPPPYMP